MTKPVFDMLWLLDHMIHIIEHFQACYKIAYKSLQLFVQNLEKDQCVGFIFGNQFHVLLLEYSWLKYQTSHI